MTRLLVSAPDAPLPEHAPPATPPSALSPTQREVLALLGTPPGGRPEFDESIGRDLRAVLDEELRPVAEMLGEASPPLFVGKRLLGLVHGCEGRLVAEEGTPFAWSAAAARGTVAHKAVELSVHWPGDPSPLELVDAALSRLRDGDDSLAAFLRHEPLAGLAELRGEANDRVAKFLECFPPLKRAWRPVTESRVRTEVAGGRVVLSGRVDLTLGGPRGRTAGKVLIDFKTGGFTPGDLDDLRFYALVETMRLGVPPRLVAGAYLDSGTFHCERVTEAVLESALARTVDGVQRLAELTLGGADPVLRAGRGCRWCPLADSCPVGATWFEADAA